MKELSTLALVGLGLVVGIPLGAFLQYKKRIIDDFINKLKKEGKI